MKMHELAPRLITADSPMLEGAPESMTVGQYIENCKRTNRDFGKLTVEAVYADMMEHDAVDVAVDFGGEDPEILAFRTRELVEGDPEKIANLDWAYLKMFQRHWIHYANFKRSDSTNILTWADRFAEVTEQTSIHGHVLEDGNSLEFRNERYALNLAANSIQNNLEEQAHISIVANCSTERLLRVAQELGHNIGKALAYGTHHGIEYAIEATIHV